MVWTEKHNRVTIRVLLCISIISCIVLFFVGYYIQRDIIENDLGYIYNTSDSAYFRGENVEFTDKFAKYTQYCFADKILDKSGVYELVFNDYPISRTPALDSIVNGESKFYYYYMFTASGVVNDIPTLASNRLLVDLDTGQLFDIKFQ